MISDQSITTARARIQNKIEVCWQQIIVFTDNKDDHGVMDLAVEIAALKRSLGEFERAEKETKI